MDEGLCAKMDERRRNDTFTRDAVRMTEHDQSGFDRDQSNGSSFSNQVCCHPDDEFHDGQGLVAAVAVHPRKILV